MWKQAPLLHDTYAWLIRDDFTLRLAEHVHLLGVENLNIRSVVRSDK